MTREEGNRLSLLLNGPSRALKSGRVHEATSKPKLYRRTSLRLVLQDGLVYIQQGLGKGYSTQGET